MNSAKELIIEQTTLLIDHYQGEMEQITAREIAEKSGVGLGLINYHFKSKDNLIAICVQRIIDKVIHSFNIEQEFTNDKDRLIAWAEHVFTFLFEHPSISRISILSDMKHYSAQCNSLYTQLGFMKALSNESSVEKKRQIALMLTSTMQVAFLMDDTAQKIYGYNFNRQEDRYHFIKNTVTLLLGE